jgi:flagellar basal-body rod modification protein FlgD
MATVADVQVNSAIGIDGNSYTTAISNDKLTNDDFLKLLLEEMKMQDPTEPMDSQRLMDSQLKMSTIQANVDMSTAMTSLQAAYANSALSNAASLIGKIVEDGQIGDDGYVKSYKVQNVESLGGELYLNVNQMIGYLDTLYDAENETYVLYDSNGQILDSDGEATGVSVQMEDGRFKLDDSGKLVLLDKDGEVITDEAIIAKYTYGGEMINYSDETSKILVSSVQKIW